MRRLNIFDDLDKINMLKKYQNDFKLSNDRVMQMLSEIHNAVDYVKLDSTDIHNSIQKWVSNKDDFYQ